MYSLQLYELCPTGASKLRSQIPPSMSTNVMQVDISDKNRSLIKLQFRDNQNQQYITKVFDKLSFSEHPDNRLYKQNIERKKPLLVDRAFTRHKNADDDIESLASDQAS